jgi:hypothetical protein
VANDELITVSAGLPWSRIAGRQRAQEHVKRKGKGCRGGNARPQLPEILVHSKHRDDLATSPLTRS